MHVSARRPVTGFLLVLLLVSALLATMLGGVGRDRASATTPGSSAKADYPPQPVYTYPTNAAKLFRWGVEAWKDEFEVNPLRGDWETSAGGDVVTRNGMITLMAYPDSGTVTATPTSQKAKVGRWEARVRVWEKNRNVGTPYRAYWELIPNKKYRCGAKSIVIASYSQDELQATGAVRTLPDNEFSFSRTLPLTQGWFHTFAVEVTDDHISWFVDTKVIHTERRSEALSNVKFKPRFRLQAVEGASMRPTWMQMDWVRYYTLKRPNALPIVAPEMTKGTYADAC